MSRHLPCPDFGQFNNAVLDVAAAEFDKMSGMDLLSVYMAVEDDIRAEINRAVSSMLGAPDYDTGTLAKVWGAEPSVRGSKKPPCK